MWHAMPKVCAHALCCTMRTRARLDCLSMQPTQHHVDCIALISVGCVLEGPCHSHECLTQRSNTIVRHAHELTAQCYLARQERSTVNEHKPSRGHTTCNTAGARSARAKLFWMPEPRRQRGRDRREEHRDAAHRHGVADGLSIGRVARRFEAKRRPLLG